MSYRTQSVLSCLAGICLCSAWASAEVRLPKIFGSHMVLQQEKPITIWGWASPGEAVSLQLGTERGQTIANNNGQWKTTLPSLKATNVPLTLKVSGSNTITYDDVLVGEVWLCSGQSNMRYGIGNIANAKQEIAAADYPKIRLMKVGASWKASPQDDIDGQWRRCSPESVMEGGWKGFSAVAYFFGRDLHKALNVPIGLIDASWGGTVIQSWTAPEGFASLAALKPDFDKLPAGIRSSSNDRELRTAPDSTTSRSTGTATASSPTPINVNASTALFNGMIHPLCPFAIRGVIWYQGEANHSDGSLYTERMKGLIGGWRQLWGEGNFPFYFVQIAPFAYSGRADAVPLFWEAQAAAEAQIPNTGMIVINDIGNPKTIHPKDKEDVGHRLALRALTDTYGKTGLLSHSPTFKSMTTKGNVLRVTFNHTGSGLASRNGAPINWFEISDAGGTFQKATARLDGDSVLLTSEGVKHPIAVRFAWNMLADPNLVNSAGLPVSAFHAGDMHGITPTTVP